MPWPQCPWVGRGPSPSAQRLEGVMVHDENAAGTVWGAKGADVDAVGATVEGVGAAVARPLLWLYYLDDHWPCGVGLGVDHVDVRGFQTGYEQVPALDVRVGRVGAKAAEQAFQPKWWTSSPMPSSILPTTCW